MRMRAMAHGGIRRPSPLLRIACTSGQTVRWIGEDYSANTAPRHSVEPPNNGHIWDQPYFFHSSEV